MKRVNMGNSSRNFGFKEKEKDEDINCTVVISGDVIVGDFSFLFTCNF